jgi:hypothetical protein
LEIGLLATLCQVSTAWKTQPPCSPYEAARFIEAASIGEHERELICWKNAAKLLRL